MTKSDKKFTVNYNGEEIKPGEVMIPFEYTEGDAANCINKECIKTVKVAGKHFKVIYKAVPEEWAKVGKSALSLVENEALGKYTYQNSVSIDMLEEEYKTNIATTPSAEELMMEKEELDETIKTFVELMHSLIEKSAKIGYAVLLMHTGVKGEEFYSKMKLSHNPANIVQRQAESILKDGLANFEVDSIKAYKNKYDEEYRAEALKLLDKIIEMYR